MKTAELYRERIRTISESHQRLTGMRAEGHVSVDARQVEQAVELATGWAKVADGRSIPFDDLDAVVDLAKVAFEAVVRVDQQWASE